MARMFPRSLPDFVRSDPRRRAECKVYDGLAAALDDSFHVFFSVAWLARMRSGQARDGEIDFVIAHPDLGVLLLEVKGGGIARDGATGAWTSLGRDGPHAIKDPVAQLRTSKYALLGKLSQHPAWGQRRIDIGHLLVLPDSAPPARGDLAADAPHEIVVFRDDMRQLDPKVREVFAFWHARTEGRMRLGREGVDVLTALLAPTFELRVPMSTAISEDDRALVTLTEQQFRVLDMLSRQRRVAITGGAGTGKTLLAIEKAKRLARQGFRTLLTCFNRPLADHLRTLVEGTPGLDVLSFHQLCWETSRRAGIPLASPDGQAGRVFYESVMPDAFVRALDKVQERYDAILVDEAQDFLDSWWTPLLFALGDPSDGVLYVFYDDNQRLYRRVSSFPTGLVEIGLTENCRNTRRINAFASTFYTGAELTAGGPEGRDVEFIVAAGGTLEKAVGRVLHRLLRVEALDARDVGVLGGVARERSALGRVGRIGAFAVSADAESDQVVLQTIHRFKGLERPVIVLAEIDEAAKHELDSVMYVGVTRARAHLIVVAAAETVASIRELPMGAATSLRPA